MDDAFNELTYDDAENVVDGHFDDADFGATDPPPGGENPLHGLFATSKLNEVRKFGELGSNLQTHPVSPLDWHMNIGEDELAVKRRRVEIEDAVSSTTLKILEARLKRKTQTFSMGKESGNNGTVVKNVPKYNEKKVPETKSLLRYPPMDGLAWFGMSSADGNLRRYVTVRSSIRETNQRKKGANLVHDEIYQLLERIQLDRPLQTGPEQAPIYARVDDPRLSSTLWIDKYSPTNFLDLLTDDETNRLVLLWLRLWHSYVLHKKTNFFESMDQRDRSLVGTETKWGITRPKFKILLLHGSSGIGKSVLANIAAKQAGYRPFVINLNELSNTAELETLLDNSSNSTSLNFHFRLPNAQQQEQIQGSQPNCIIVEGVEFASAELITFLCRWTARREKAVRKRPIICTCNNLYVPNLRELRTGYAMVVRVNACQKERITKRIKTICVREGVRMGSSQLQNFVQLYGADIRLCLNTLQFITANALRANYGNGVSIDFPQIETSVSIFDSLTAVLTLDPHLNKKGALKSAPERCHALLGLLNRVDDFARFLQLLFSNLFSSLALTNSQCKRLSHLFVELDLGQTAVSSGQHFTLLRYQPFYILAIHLLCAVLIHRRVQFNAVISSQNERQKETRAIVQSLQKASSTASQKFLTDSDVLFLVPHLHFILQPPLKPMNVQLSSGRELSLINRLVQIMRSLGITFMLKYDENTAVYSFEPPIDVIACLNVSKRREQRIHLPEAIKEFIAQQIKDAPANRIPSPLLSIGEQTGKGSKVPASIEPLPQSSTLNAGFRFRFCMISLMSRSNYTFSHQLMERDIPQLIESACFAFLGNLFSDNEHDLIQMPQPTTPNVPSSNPDVLTTSIQPPPFHLWLRPKYILVFAYRLRVLCQVYGLLIQGRKATRRDLYYENKKLFKCQHNFNNALSVVCKFLNTDRKSLNIVSCSRGFIIGNLILSKQFSQDQVDFRASPVAIFEGLMNFELVESDALFLLVVEKDSVFQRLIDEQFTQKYPQSILVTGRGYPDICTRHFLNWLCPRIGNPPLLALVDADPYGIEIFCTYKYGSERSRTESGEISLVGINWIGLFPSETDDLPIAPQHFLPLMPSDRRRIVRLSAKIRARGGEDLVVSELATMERIDRKLEIEAVGSITGNYLTEIYLRPKFPSAAIA